MRVRVGHEDSSPGPVDLSYQLTVSDVHEENSELEVIDLYAVRIESNESQEKGAKPFIHQVKLHGPGGEIVRVWGLFDDGAMVDAMSMETYNRVRHRLSPLGRSTRQLRMANGNVVSPLGCWKGTVELNGTTVEGSFEVFDSGGGWDFLFGKRLMTAFAAVHDYATDEVFIPRHQLTLRNQHDIATQQRRQASRKPHARHKEEEHKDERGDEAKSPVRGVLMNHVNSEFQVVDVHIPAAELRPDSAITQDHLPRASELESEKQERLVGDEVMSPSREVPATTPKETESTADKDRRYRTTVEEEEDDEEQKHRTKESEEKSTEAPENQPRSQQNDDKEEQQRLRNQRKERAKKMWKVWKGPSQRRHRRWKTRNTNIARAK